MHLWPPDIPQDETRGRWNREGGGGMGLRQVVRCQLQEGDSFGDCSSSDILSTYLCPLRLAPAKSLAQVRADPTVQQKSTSRQGREYMFPSETPPCPTRCSILLWCCDCIGKGRNGVILGCEMDR